MRQEKEKGGDKGSEVDACLMNVCFVCGQSAGALLRSWRFVPGHPTTISRSLGCLGAWIAWVVGSNVGKTSESSVWAWMLARAPKRCSVCFSCSASVVPRLSG